MAGLSHSDSGLRMSATFAHIESMRSFRSTSVGDEKSVAVDAGPITNVPYFAPHARFDWSISDTTHVVEHAPRAPIPVNMKDPFSRSAVEDTEEDEPWSLERPADDGTVESPVVSTSGSRRHSSMTSGKMSPTTGTSETSKRSGEQVPAASRYLSPLSAVSIEAARSTVVVHLVPHNSTAPSDIVRYRLARWIQRQADKFLFAWWIGAGSPALLDSGLLELLEQLDPTGCAPVLASHVSGNAAALGDAVGTSTAQHAPSVSGRQMSTKPRAGLPVFRAAVELNPHKLKTCLLVLDGVNYDVLNHFVAHCAPRFGLHVIALCNDGLPPKPQALAQLTEVRTMDLSIPDADRRERFATLVLDWNGIHVTSAEEAEVNQRRKLRDAVLAERKRLPRDPADELRSHPLGRSQNSKRGRTSLTTNDDADELDEEDVKLAEDEMRVADKVMQLQRLARRLRYSPSLLAVAHRFVAQQDVSDIHQFVRDVCDAAEAVKTFRFTRAEDYIRTNRVISNARALLAPETAFMPSAAPGFHATIATPSGSSRPVLSPSRRLSMGPLASLGTPSASGTFSSSQTPLRMSPTLGDPIPSTRAKNLPPRRRSNRTRSLSFASEISEVPSNRPLGSEQCDIVGNDGVPVWSRRRGVCAEGITSDDAAGLLAVIISSARSNGVSEVPEPLIEIARRRSLALGACDNDRLTAEDVGVLQLSLALPAVFPATVFGRDVVRRMENFGFWARLSPNTSSDTCLVQVAPEVLGGLELLCHVLDQTGPTKVGPGVKTNELLGGYVASTTERAYAIAGSWLHQCHRTKRTEPQWIRWQRSLNSFVVDEVGRRSLFLPDVASLLLPPRAPPADLSELPDLPTDATTWSAQDVATLLGVLPDLEGRGRHDDAAMLLERVLAVCVSLLDRHARRGYTVPQRGSASFAKPSRDRNADKLTGAASLSHTARSVNQAPRISIGTLVSVYCVFKELVEVHAKARTAGVGEKYAERAFALARAICGDRRDTPAMGEAHFLLGHVHVQLSVAEATRGAVTQQTRLLSSDVGSNMQLSAVLRADVERKQYIVDASKHFAEAVSSWQQVPPATIGEELAMCHKVLSAAMTHELRDRDALKCARHALEAAAGAKRSTQLALHQLPADSRQPLALRDALEWSKGQLPTFIAAVRDSQYDVALQFIETSISLVYLGAPRPALRHEEVILAAGAHSDAFRGQLRPQPTFQEHLRCYTTVSDVEVAQHHGTHWTDGPQPPVVRGPPPSDAQFAAVMSASSSNRSPSGVSIADSILPMIKAQIRASSQTLHTPPAALLPSDRAGGTTSDATRSRAHRLRAGVSYEFAAHVLLETCDPADVRALDLLAKILDSGFDPRVCSPDRLETLLHVAVRRNLVLFIGLLLAHPLVEVEYSPPYRLVARRDGLSTQACLEKVPLTVPSPLEVCNEPLTVELLLLKGHTPTETFQRHRAMCVAKLARTVGRLPRLFGAAGNGELESGMSEPGVYRSEVPAILLDGAIDVPDRETIAPFCPVDRIFGTLERLDQPNLVRALTQLVWNASLRDSDALDATLAALDPPQLKGRGDLARRRRPTIASEAAMSTSGPMAVVHPYFSKAVLSRFAVAMTQLIRAGLHDCVSVLTSEFQISIDVVHWEDAAEHRKDRRARQDRLAAAADAAAGHESLTPTGRTAADAQTHLSPDEHVFIQAFGALGASRGRR
jgi:hypothetical protein